MYWLEEALLIGALVVVRTHDVLATIERVQAWTREAGGEEGRPARKARPCHIWMQGLGLRDEERWLKPFERVAASDTPLLASHLQRESDPRTVYVMVYPNLGSPDVQSQLLEGIRYWKKVEGDGRTLVLLLAPGYRLPPLIERFALVVDEGLPNEQALLDLVVDNASTLEVSLAPEEVPQIARELRGLTLYQAENTLALAVERTGHFDLVVLRQMRAQLIRDVAGLSVVSELPEWEAVGGLGRLKTFLDRSARHPHARGVLLTGVPGCGKSMVARALGQRLNVPVLTLDVGRLFASQLGESERNLEAALAAVDSLGRVVLILDEIEKAVAGGQNGGRNDGGVAARLLARLLAWFEAERESYVVATCNRFELLPPELQRAGRFDAAFFVDLPTSEERVTIAETHHARYGTGSPHQWHYIEQVTGSEIEAAFRLAQMLDTTAEQAVETVVTRVAVARAEEIAALREQTKGRFIPASA